MLNFKNKLENNQKMAIFFLVAFILIVAPIMVFSGRKKDLYVNANASGSQNGSAAHPYKTIEKALDKADGKTEIHVAKGEYKENITLKKGVKLFGEGSEKTIIKARNDNRSTVYLEDDSEINGVSILDGKNGVLVNKYAEAKIIDCVIKYNSQNGIYVEGKFAKKRDQVLVSKTEIKKNGRTGIYVEGPRRMVIMESDILQNKSDGIDFAGGVSSWLEDNRIRNNGGSGFKIVADGADIWTKSNDIRENKREGVEVSFYGDAGKIDLAKSKIVKNGRYGIARLRRSNNANYASFNQILTFGNKVELWENNFGNVSNYIFVK